MSMLSRIGLRTKVAALASAGALLYATFAVSTHTGMTTLERVAKQRADAVLAAMFIPIEKFEPLPEVLATHAELRAALRAPQQKAALLTANAHLQYLTETIGADTIFLMNTAGLTVASSNWRSTATFVGRNYGFRPYHEQAMLGRTSHFYGLGVSSGTPGYYIAHPVRDGDAIIGAVVVKVDLNGLDRQWAKTPNHEVAVADEFDINFLSTNGAWKYRPMYDLSAAQLRHLATTRQYGKLLKTPLRVGERRRLPGGTALVDLEVAEERSARRTYVMHEAALPNTNWTARIFVPAASVHERAWRHCALSAMLLGCAWLVYLYRREMRARRAERQRAQDLHAAAHAELARQHEQLKILTAELHHKAITDPATGCYNRGFFFEQVARLVSSAQRHGYPLSIIMLDVDHFKRINDGYGHPAGDAVLQHLANLCAANMRDEDIFARFGGEEFIIALAHTDAPAAVAAAERLHQALGQMAVTLPDGQYLSITVSCGVSEYDPQENSIDAALRRADSALYTAKRAGRDRVVLATKGDCHGAEAAGGCEGLPPIPGTAPAAHVIELSRNRSVQPT